MFATYQLMNELSIQHSYFLKENRKNSSHSQIDKIIAEPLRQGKKLLGVDLAPEYLAKFFSDIGK